MNVEMYLSACRASRVLQAREIIAESTDFALIENEELQSVYQSLGAAFEAALKAEAKYQVST